MSTKKWGKIVAHMIIRVYSDSALVALSGRNSMSVTSIFQEERGRRVIHVVYESVAHNQWNEEHDPRAAVNTALGDRWYDILAIYPTWTRVLCPKHAEMCGQKEEDD